MARLLPLGDGRQGPADRCMQRAAGRRSRLSSSATSRSWRLPSSIGAAGRSARSAGEQADALLERRSRRAPDPRPSAAAGSAVGDDHEHVADRDLSGAAVFAPSRALMCDRGHPGACAGRTREPPRPPPPGPHRQASQGNFGVERDSLRVSEDEQMSMTRLWPQRRRSRSLLLSLEVARARSSRQSPQRGHCILAQLATRLRLAQRRRGRPRARRRGRSSSAQRRRVSRPPWHRARPARSCIARQPARPASAISPTRAGCRGAAWPPRPPLRTCARLGHGATFDSSFAGRDSRRR